MVTMETMTLTKILTSVFTHILKFYNYTNFITIKLQEKIINNQNFQFFSVSDHFKVDRESCYCA